MGVYIDPSYAFPLPIFGINYLNFAFGGPDSQLAVLFAGVLAAGNIQRSKLGGTPLDASVDFFAIAVPSSDRLYSASGEHSGERVLTWPMSTGLNLGWQYTAFQKLTGQYQFRFDAYVHDTTTAADFTLPASTITNGVGIAWEYRRGGYTLMASDTEYRRARWAAWGSGIDASTAPATAESYSRYQVTLSRDWYFKSVPEGARQRRVFRWTGPGSVFQVSVRDVRRHTHPRCARLGRSLCRARHAPRGVHDEHLRHLPGRPVCRAGVGTRSRGSLGSR